MVTATTDVSNTTLDKKRKLKGEIGVTGTPVFAGQILAEPNSELRFPMNLAIYDRMRRSDGQVRSSLLAITLPILSLDWEVEPFADKDESSGQQLEPTPDDISIAHFVRKDMFETLVVPWKEVLRELLGMLWAGFWLVEPVFEVGEDGLVHLKKIASRLPGSVFRWQISRDGSLQGIIQRAVNPENGVTEQIEIDAKDLVIFTHEKEGADWTGMSVLRSAYKHWYMKDWLYRIGVINVERGGGFPVISLPDQADDDDLRQARNVGESIHLHERAYVLEPSGWKFRLEHATSKGMGDVMTQVEHHDHKISANILAQFMDFGVTPNGTRAAAGEFINLFLMAEDAVIANVEDTINRDLIPKIVDKNWRVKGYPKVKAQNVRGFNVQRLGVVLRALADGQLIYPDDKLETFLRRSMGLPEADLETRRDRSMFGFGNVPKDPLQAALRPNKPDETPGGTGGINVGDQGDGDPTMGNLRNANPEIFDRLVKNLDPQTRARFANDSASWWKIYELAAKRIKNHTHDFKPVDLDAPVWYKRQLTVAERWVNLHEIDMKTKTAAKDLVAKIEPIQNQQLTALAKIARRELDGVTEVRVPYVGKVASVLKSVLKDVFTYGREQVRAELMRQVSVKRAPGAKDIRLSELEMKLAQPISTRKAAFDFFSAKADVLSERWANRMKDAAVSSKLRAIRAGLDEEATEAEVREALEELSRKSTRALMLQTISEAFALGRTVEAENLSGDIERVQYSALLDGNTCDVCEDLDGKTGPIDDPQLQTPNPNCVGERYGNSCRCINVYELRP